MQSWWCRGRRVGQSGSRVCVRHASWDYDVGNCWSLLGSLDTLSTCRVASTDARWAQWRLHPQKQYTARWGQKGPGKHTLLRHASAWWRWRVHTDHNVLRDRVVSNAPGIRANHGRSAHRALPLLPPLQGEPVMPCSYLTQRCIRRYTVSFAALSPTGLCVLEGHMGHCRAQAPLHPLHLQQAQAARGHAGYPTVTGERRCAEISCCGGPLDVSALNLASQRM